LRQYFIEDDIENKSKIEKPDLHYGLTFSPEQFEEIYKSLSNHSSKDDRTKFFQGDGIFHGHKCYEPVMATINEINIRNELRGMTLDREEVLSVLEYYNQIMNYININASIMDSQSKECGVKIELDLKLIF
jgi:hypothetical protein